MGKVALVGANFLRPGALLAREDRQGSKRYQAKFGGGLCPSGSITTLGVGRSITTLGVGRRFGRTRPGSPALRHRKVTTDEAWPMLPGSPKCWVCVLTRINCLPALAQYWPASTSAAPCASSWPIARSESIKVSGPTVCDLRTQSATALPRQPI